MNVIAVAIGAYQVFDPAVALFMAIRHPHRSLIELRPILNDLADQLLDIKNKFATNLFSIIVWHQI